MAKAKKEEDKSIVETVVEKVADVAETVVEKVADTATAVVDAVTPDSDKEEKATAKAGKRSAKAIEAAEEKAAKEERKAANVEAEAAEGPKQRSNPTRPRIERQGKNFRSAAEKVEKDKTYTLSEAIALAITTSPIKFDATVEVHVNLNVDPRHADQNIRDNLVLPAGTGKSVRVAVFADDAVEGADLSGVEAILKDLEKGAINFDILIATPANMAKLGKFARVLGPRGLMPNPKSGTVTTDVAKAVSEAKAGRVEYRVDSTGIVHIGAGKVSFGTDKIEQNLRAIFASLKSNKPASVKSSYVKAIHLATTMGPSIKVGVNEL
ncbi:MAG TPA: 50S ribosomal protein L1 [Candidatus Saccharimonadales bacterium]|nr:50S ribosomal protein L1 [Candidatus Saccharimonadales bacterium]